MNAVAGCSDGVASRSRSWTGEVRVTDTNAVRRIERAIETTGLVVTGVAEGRWTNRTPCEEWDARAVLNHTVGGMRIFAAELNGTDPGADHESDWLGADPISRVHRGGGGGPYGLEPPRRPRHHRPHLARRAARPDGRADPLHGGLRPRRGPGGGDGPTGVGGRGVVPRNSCRSCRAWAASTRTACPASSAPRCSLHRARPRTGNCWPTWGARSPDPPIRRDRLIRLIRLICSVR